MKILLLASAFNGLTQRAWLELRRAGHDVTVELSVSPQAMREAVELADPDLIICPFLKDRVPAEIWQHRRTIVVHPGPPGDRGPSALDWAITEAAPCWGVTALQAVEDMDAGDIWASRTFPLPPEPPTKSALYNGAVADTAIELIHEVVRKAADPAFVPAPLDYGRPDVWGRLRRPLRQPDRAFDWADAPEHIVRRIRAADGSPGVLTVVCGLPVYAYDAHPGQPPAGEPGTIAARRHGAVLVRAGSGGVWLGHLRAVPSGAGPTIKLPATTVLADRLAGVPDWPAAVNAATGHPYREISYRRDGQVGVLDVDFYNGAMSTAQCRRLGAALRHAAEQDTRVLVIHGGRSAGAFSNGIHLNVIDAAPNPALEGWRNIVAIDDVCRQVLTATRQIVVTAVAGNAGAGGVMLALGADHVLLRQGTVLNPHYQSIGLFGSEYWTYTLPRRVGRYQAGRLTSDCLPIGAADAVTYGLADAALPRDPAAFDAAVAEYAHRLAGRDDHSAAVSRKRQQRESDERRKPLEAYRAEELAEMSRDLFADRNGFAAARRAFVTKRSPSSTPHRIALHRPAADPRTTAPADQAVA
ncbi:MAG TPA: hydrogenase maturation protein [Mycobacteriales bacterium]|jgi:putative two-component system hydrogenase maturation factor HypX/HoxX